MKDLKRFNVISDCLMVIGKQLEMIIHTSDTPDMLQDAQFMMVSCDELGKLNVKYLKHGEVYKEPEPDVDKGMRKEYQSMLESMSQVERDRLLMGNFVQIEEDDFKMDALAINDLNGMGLTNIPGAEEGPEPGTNDYDEDTQNPVDLES